MNRRLSDRGLAFSRFLLGGNALVTCYSALNNPRALLHQMTQNWNATTLLWSLGVVGLAILVDVFINDILPKRFTWKFAIEHRHFLFIALIFSYAAQVYVSVVDRQENSLVYYYVWNASAILLFAFIDAKKRARDAQWVMSYN